MIFLFLMVFFAIWVQGHNAPAFAHAGMLTCTALLIGFTFRDSYRAKQARIRTRVYRPRIPRCRQCGYDLRATPERCPECGAIPTMPK